MEGGWWVSSSCGEWIQREGQCLCPHHVHLVFPGLELTTLLRIYSLKVTLIIQLSLEQQECELCLSTYTRIFFNKSVPQCYILCC